MTGAEFGLALTALKELKTLLEKNKDKAIVGEIFGRVNEIQIQLTELHSRHLEIQIDNERLKKSVDLSLRVTPKGSFVYLDGNFEKPFCEHCWYANAKTIPLIKDEEEDYSVETISPGTKRLNIYRATYECPACKVIYDGE